LIVAGVKVLLVEIVRKDGTSRTNIFRPGGWVVIATDWLAEPDPETWRLTEVGRLELYAVTDRLTGVAAAYVLFPACDAVTVHMPGPVRLAVWPATLQLPEVV
jgi:hypothetical protein